MSDESTYKISRHDNIGTAGAEDDEIYLGECFVDTGDLSVLLNRREPKSIVVGRTGSGKTALLREVANVEDNVISLSPHTLSLNYIANNNTIAFFENVGVNLSVFYGVLWKHILVVELLRRRFNIVDESGQHTFKRYIDHLLTSKNVLKEHAIDYLEKWGNKFWLTSEQRMKELTEKVEKELKGSLGVDFGVANINASGAMKLTSEEKTQIVEHGQRAVSQVQVRELENIFLVLEEDVFSDSQKPYYITIDMLDEEWVDSRIKLQLIKSLIDTVRRFRSLSNVKVVVSLRRDLLDEVIYSTTDAGFQEEKYTSLYLYVKWNKRQLYDLVNSRVRSLVKRKYTNADVSFEELFPNKVDGVDAFDYIVNRTLYRPRDAIMFVNSCLSSADEQSAVTARVIKEAEEEYSHERLKSLSTEWLSAHPYLMQVVCMFRGMPQSFQVSDIKKEWLEDRFIDASEDIDDPAKDSLTAQINKLTTGTNYDSVRSYLVVELYRLGLFGIKTSGSSTTNWPHLSKTYISTSDVRGQSTVHIHPAYHRALDVKHRST